MSEEEVVDPKPAIEESCKPQCSKYKKEYDACVDRITASGIGHCTGQYLDYYHCIDNCAAKKIFAVLK